ncbi:MAG: acetoin utilization protein AcuC [Elstera sp.]
MDRPILIAGEIYRDSSYGRRHPLAIARVSSTVDLIRALGWLDPSRYIDAPQATPEQLARFHAPDYIAALAETEAAQAAPLEVREKYNIGRAGNPIFPEMFRRPATAAGAGLLAADLIAQGARCIHSPAGGTHHGRPAQASGFCYVNDPALTLLRLLDQGFARVLYLDFDAHHGDGVEAAFIGDPRVLCVSIHEEKRWPFSGALTDRAEGSAFNLPVPADFNDSELGFITETLVLPLGRAFAPEVVVIQAGADGLAEDPLSRLTLSNGALWQAVRAGQGLAPQAIILGGGGYNPWSVTRAWAGLWGCLNGFDLPGRLPAAGEAVLRGLVWDHRLGRTPPEDWFTTLKDRPRPGPIRPEISQGVDWLLAEAAQAGL